MTEITLLSQKLLTIQKPKAKPIVTLNIKILVKVNKLARIKNMTETSTSLSLVKCFSGFVINNSFDI